MSNFNRRDFLKVLTALFGGAALSAAHPLADLAEGRRDSGKPNIILLVLDAMSARNLSLYGYIRPTTPNLARLAERSTVYHSHYSGGNFTTPGVASMLTGAYPWTHRALGFRGLVDGALAGRNIFRLFGDEYYRFGFTQNALCGLLLSQFAADLNERLSAQSFAYLQNMPMLEEGFPRDPLHATYAFREFLGDAQGSPASVLLGYTNLVSMVATRIKKTSSYPLGTPTAVYMNFRLEEVFAGLTGTLSRLAQDHAPFFSYIHLYPPHTPFRPKRDFLKLFVNDGFAPSPKPRHPLSESSVSSEELAIQRQRYDSYIADLDHEIGLFAKDLKKNGLLDSSYVIITSDHGELFERSEQGHGTPLLYEPVIKIPLIILAPGQAERRDVYSPTSNVDLVPTLLSIAGKEIPPEIEGRILPGLGGAEAPDRSVFTVFAKENSSFLPLTKSVTAIIKGANKLIYYRGYPANYDEKFELYNLKDDSDELRDLIADDPITAKRLKEEMLDSLYNADRLYRNRHGLGSP
jgi:arylsulfatase A-like enzyme